jgi:adenylate cyclase
VTDPLTAPPHALEQLRLWHRFHVRLTLLYGGTICIVIVCMGFLSYRIGAAAELSGLQQRLLTVASSIATMVDAAALAEVPLGAEATAPQVVRLREQLTAIASHDPDIESIYLLRPTDEPTRLRFFVDVVVHGKSATPGDEFIAANLPFLFQGFENPVVEDRPYADEFALSLSGYAPVRNAANKVIALAGVDINATRLDDLQANIWRVTALLFGAALLLVTAASLLVARSIRNPLSAMISATTLIAGGKLDTRLGLTRQDEFGLLGQHFDNMAVELGERQFIRDTFGRYVSEEVARTLLARGKDLALGGEERVITILFSDLRNYTAISEQLTPGQMVSMLNEYFGVMNEVIDKHHGCIIEFLGDAILAVFGAPDYQVDHAESATRCAIAMREGLEQLNKAWQNGEWAAQWRRAGIDRIEQRIGIHTGPVVAGNLGSPTRMKYAVIGDSVNVASRLETLNKELSTTILLSEDVRERLHSDLVAQCQDRGEFAVKGRQKRLRVYSL